MLGALVNLIIYLLVLGIIYAIGEYVITNLITRPACAYHSCRADCTDRTGSYHPAA